MCKLRNGGRFFREVWLASSKSRKPIAMMRRTRFARLRAGDKLMVGSFRLIVAREGVLANPVPLAKLTRHVRPRCRAAIRTII